MKNVKNNLPLTKIRKLILTIVCIVVVLLIPTFAGHLESGAYYLNVLNYIFVYAIASTGLNIMTGYSG